MINVYKRVLYNNLAIFLTCSLLQYSNPVDYLGLLGKMNVVLELVLDFDLSRDVGD